MLRQYIENDTREPDSLDSLRNDHQKIVREQLVPRIIERNRTAVMTDARMCWFYQRRQHGRRCSCHDIETSADGLCCVCFGSSIVGGYDRYGFCTDVMDVTYPNIAMTNVRPAFERQTRPVLFTLEPGALLGSIELQVPLRPNRRRVERVEAPNTHIRPGAKIEFFVRAPAEAAWAKLTQETLEQRLTEQRLLVRAEFSRRRLDVDPPLMSHLLWRYFLVDDPLIPLDMARDERSVVLQEIGIKDEITLSAWAANHLQRITNDDFFRRIEDDTDWKVRTVTVNRSAGQVTSFDLGLRIAIPSLEAYARVP